MTTDQVREPRGPAGEAKAAARAMWALGDYPKVSRDLLTAFGPRLVDACGIGPGMRVLDVAAGAGNVAIAAAAAGAEVIASDLTPELFEAGRVAAAARGVELQWREADAEALPFADGTFDVVTSAVGAMFAPDHRATAAELLRVTRPGGTIGLITWTPDGSVGHFFATLAPYAPPPPPGASSPLEWGREDYVRDLLGDGARSLEFVRETTPWLGFGTPAELPAYYKAHFGPVIAAYANQADDPERSAALEADFLAYAERANTAPPGEPARFQLDYLLSVAVKDGPEPR